MFNATAAQIVFKNPVRIIQITDDQIETGEIICQLRWQFGIPGEETREAPVFNGAHRLRVKTVFSECRDMFVAKNLDPGLRPCVT